MNAYRKILPLLKRAFEAARVNDQNGDQLFNNFEQYAATLMTDLSLLEAKGWLQKVVDTLFDKGLSPEEIQDHEDLQVVLLFVGNSELIEDADELEDWVTLCIIKRQTQIRL